MSVQIEQLHKYVVEGKRLMCKWSEDALTKEKTVNFGDVLVTLKAKDVNGWREEIKNHSGNSH